MEWLLLRSIDDLQGVISSSIPVLFFKHSPRCIISKMVKTSFEQSWDVADGVCQTVLIDVINQRDLSNTVAAQLDVNHQSPQAILLHHENVLYSKSHQAVNADEVKEILSAS